jgi:tetratricopeptide (TPR) repeat protein
LAEFGLLGAVAGVVVALSFGCLIVRAIRSDDRIRRQVALAALFGVVLLAVQQVADMLVNVPALLLAIALPVAWLDAAALDQRARGRRSNVPVLRLPAWFRERAVPLVMATVACVVAIGLLRMESVTGVDVQAVSAANNGKWADAVTLARQAADADPNFAVYQFTLGVAAADAGDLPLAEPALEKSAAADDYTYAWLDLAAVRWRLGDAAGARAALSRAERLGLQRATVALPAGWLRQQLGDRQAAITDYAAALANAPTLADDPFWSSSPALRNIWPEVWTAGQAVLGGRGLLELDLVAGQVQLATQVAASLSPGDRTLYSLVVPAWRGDTASWAALQALASAHPLDSDPVSWCDLVAAHLGDRAAADNYSLWLAINNSPDSGLPQVVRVAMDKASGLPWLILDRYGSLYRRPVPDAQVVSALPQLTWQDHF